MKYNFEQKRNDYQTPPELYNMALQWLNIDFFDLDVCCSQNNIPAKHYYINGFADGLKWDWAKYNWCNPPFDQCDKWMKKAYKEQQNGKNTIMLIPVRTETKYWHEYVINNPLVDMNKDIIFLRKGYSFISPETNKSMGIFKNALCLIYFRGINMHPSESIL